jgi:hypothetical protein
MRGTVRYLLPVLLSPDILPAAVLKNCQQAVDDRNNVVHSGQRDVPRDKLVRYLEAIREMCNILAHLSA